MIKIFKVSYSEICAYANAAKRERSIVSDQTGLTWFGAYDNGVLVGFGGAIAKKGSGRIKGTYVLPEFRGNGISKYLNAACFNFLVDEKKVCIINAFVTTDRNRAWYLKNGFKEIREKKGIAYMERTV